MNYAKNENILTFDAVNDDVLTRDETARLPKCSSRARLPRNAVPNLKCAYSVLITARRLPDSQPKPSEPVT